MSNRTDDWHINVNTEYAPFPLYMCVHMKLCVFPTTDDVDLEESV